MDTLERYRKIIRDVLTALAERRYSQPAITNEAIFDTVNDRYLVMSTGWEGEERRIHFCLAHLDIIDGKIWIQRDNTEEGIGYALQEAGVPAENIVPAFHPPTVRKLAGYAVA
jgi:hypothetical protein